MLAEMTVEDWHGWQEYFALHGGLGPQDEWRYRGAVLSFLYNPNRAEKAPALTPEEFFPWLKALEPPPPPLTPEQEARAAKRMMWALKVQAWKERSLPLAREETP